MASSNSAASAKPSNHSGSVPDRDKALDAALSQIERQFGKGSVMRMGDEGRAPVEVIPTGSIALDVALGIGGLPRGRVVEVYGPESSGKTTVALHAIANAQKLGGIAAFIDAEHALDPEYAARLGVDIDALLVSQPDTGEQALEIADMLIRSGAIDIIVIDSVAALVPRAEIEGEMGDSHVGLQARLMSQALRKMTGALSGTNTTAIFINQLREKIGVMFGCFHYDTRVCLADGTTKKIGTIVNQKLPVDVMSYNAETGRVEPRRVVNWFDNGIAEEFLQFTVEKTYGNGRTQFAATRNHSISTPDGWEEAGDLAVGDQVLVTTQRVLSDEQLDLIKGALMGDGALSRKGDRRAVRFRMGHGIAQAEYLNWKAGLLGNVSQTRHTNRKETAMFVDFTALDELSVLKDEIYRGEGRKTFSHEYLRALSPLAWAVWYMDDGSLSIRSQGKQKRTQGLSGRIEWCVEAMTPESRQAVVDVLQEKFGVEATLKRRGKAGKSVITLNRAATDRFLDLVYQSVHPSMEYKVLPGQRGHFVDKDMPQIEAYTTVRPARILDISVKPQTRSMHKFDIEVEGDHNYMVDGAMVHNSPETTTGGRALKFYSSVRLDVRRIETLKDGTDAVGNRTRVKVVKNKMAPPFKQAEFDILYGQGISREGSLIDMGADEGIVRKSGAWYTYEGDQLGQGKENARAFLRDNPDLADEIEKKIKEKLGIGARLDAPADAPVDDLPEPVDL